MQLIHLSLNLSACPQYFFDAGTAGLQIFGGDPEPSINTREACEARCLQRVADNGENVRISTTVSFT